MQEQKLSISLLPCEHLARPIWQIFMFKVQMKLHMPLGAEKVSPLSGLIKQFQTGWGVLTAHTSPSFHYSEVDRYGFVRH